MIGIKTRHFLLLAVFAGVMATLTAVVELLPKYLSHPRSLNIAEARISLQGVFPEYFGIDSSPDDLILEAARQSRRDFSTYYHLRLGPGRKELLRSSFAELSRKQSTTVPRRYELKTYEKTNAVTDCDDVIRNKSSYPAWWNICSSAETMEVWRMGWGSGYIIYFLPSGDDILIQHLQT